LEDQIFIKPFKKQKNIHEGNQGISVPISITFEEWEKWKANKKK
jgi:hypothetical protein